MLPQHDALPSLSYLAHELLAAHRRARQADLAEALAACGLPTDSGIVWGVDFVTVDQHHYAPALGGRPAVIVPYYSDGALLDLVAVGLDTRTCRTRAGICTALGEEWITRAQQLETGAPMFSDPIAWLQNGRRGACLVDWRSARHILADLPALSCDRPALSERIDRALRQPVHIPNLTVRPARPSPKAATENADAARAEWAAKVAAHKMNKAVTETHPWLDSIGFPKMLGLVHEGMLLVPARRDGRVVSLFEIAADGTTRALVGAALEGATFTFGSGRIEVLCVSYAAALSIRAALTGLCLPARVTCCFSAENLEAMAARRRHAVILADHDETSADGPGAGEAMARRTGLPWAMPPEIGCANEMHARDGLAALQALLLRLLEAASSEAPAARAAR